MTADGPRRGRVLAGLAPAWDLAWRATPGCLVPYVAVTVVMAALPVTAAWLTKLVLDLVAAPAPRPGSLLTLALGLAALGAVAAAVPHATEYLRSELDREVTRLAQDRLYRAVNRFPGLGRFENPQFLDRLRLAEQAGAGTPASTVAAMLAIAQAAATGLGFLVSLLLLSPFVALLVVAAVVPAVAAEFELSRRRAAMMWKIGPMERRRFFYSALLSDPRAAKEVRLFRLGDFLRGRMNQELVTAHFAQRRTDRREFVVQSGLGLLSAAVAGVGLVWAVLAAGRGRLTPGDVAMFVAAVAGVQGALNSLVNQVALTHQHLLLFDHYLQVIRAKPELPLADRPAALPNLRRGIEFRDVWFRYSEEHDWVLRGLSLHVPFGQSVGIVGPNGAGKSTLVKLMCRFYDPTRGAILWDGVDLRDVDPVVLRERIGAVFQDYMTYDLTATENIGLGDLTAMDDAQRIEAAARQADVHDTVAALPQGYATLLSRMFVADSEDDGQDGVLLSGGQWQRLALARAFLQDRPDLLILDEPSSGLDADAEAAIHGRMRAHRSGRTSILVSHRLGTLRDADRLVVIEGGVVSEVGTHAELLTLRGTYARLFGLQARGYAEQQPNVAVG